MSQGEQVNFLAMSQGEQVNFLAMSQGEQVTWTHYPDCEPTSLCTHSLMISYEAKNNNIFAVFGLTQTGIKPMIYRTQGIQANRYTTYAIYLSLKQQVQLLFHFIPGKVYSIQHYVEKFVSDLQQVGGFLRVLLFPPLIKLTAMIQTEILLKVALNTITLIPCLIL